MKKAVTAYKRIAGTKVNFDKSKGLRLGDSKGSNTLPEPFCSSPSASSGCYSGLTSHWSEIGQRYRLRSMLRLESGFQ